MAHVIGLRDRKKAKTRDALVTAAWELFSERGYHETTVDDIADAADISPRTFFRYFATKDDVLFARFDEALIGLGTFLNSRPAEEPIWTAIQGAAADYASQLDADRLGAKLIVETVAQSPALAARYLQSFLRIEQIVAEWVAGRLGVAADDVEPRVVAAAAVAASRVALEGWLAAGGSGDLGEHLRDALAVVTVT